MKYYCGECFEEIGNCKPDCSNAEHYEIDRTFGRLVQGWLERCNVTDAELSEAFDLSLPTVARWRAGRAETHSALHDRVRAWFETRIREGLK